MKKIKKFSEGRRIGPIHFLVLVMLAFSILPINISLIAENTKADGDNIPPVAIAEPSLQVVFVGEEAWFYGNRSYDPDGWIVSYDWYFGDGTSGTGVITSHAYTSTGNYTVTLIVTDNGDLTSNDTCDVVVMEMPPPPPPPPPSDDDWPMFNHDSQHTGFSTSDAPDTSSLLWIFNGLWPMTSPSVADGMVFVVYGEPFVCALNESTGETIWSYEIPGFPSQPVVANGRVYVSTLRWGNISEEVHIYCFDEFSGDLIWDWDTSELNLPPFQPLWFEGPPLTAANDHIYFGLSVMPDPGYSNGSMIICLNDSTGDIIWTVAVSDLGLDYMNTPLTIADNKIFVSSSSQMYALDENNGNLLWTFFEPGLTWFESAPAFSGGKLFIGCDNTDLFYCLDATLGNIIWQTTLDANYSYTTPAVAYEKVFFGARCYFPINETNETIIDPVFALDQNTGDVVWRYDTSAFVISSPAVADNKIFNSYDDGTIRALDVETGSVIWIYPTQYPSWFWHQSLAIAYGKLFASMGNVLYVFGSGGPGNQPPIAIAEPSFQTIFVGEGAWFSGYNSFDPDGYIVSYEWDFGDGTNGSGMWVTHNYTTAGTYNVTLIVTDNCGAIDSCTVQVLVEEGPPPENQPPVAIAEPPIQTVVVGEEAWFSGILSYDPDGYIISWDWDFGDGNSGSGIWVTHNYTSIGTYNVTLTVTDNLGGTDSCFVCVIVEGDGPPPVNQPPVAIAEPPIQMVFVGEIAWFSGICSYDPDGYIVSYDWDFGDGTNGSGVTITHIYNAPGNYTITLTVTDNGGLTDSDWVYVIVCGNETNPVILQTDPVDGEFGVPLNYSITIVFSNRMNPTTLNWTINPDPGGWTEAWSMDTLVLILIHSNPFDLSTMYEVEIVEIMDINGNPLMPGPVPNPWQFITVGENLPPEAVAIPEIQQVYVGEWAWFDGSLSYDPDGYIVSYDWDFGDGTSGSGIWVTHNYTTAGTYNVTLTVTDNYGATDSCVVQVLVEEEGPTPENLPPVAIADPPIQVVFIGEEAWFTGILSYDPDGYIISWHWDFGDGTSGSGIWVTHNYTTSGTYNVTLTVTDNLGATDSCFVLVIVEEEGPPPENQPPVAIIDPPFQTVFVGEEAWFSGNLSYDPDGYIVSYDWDFGDGANGSGVTTTHIYSVPGTYFITLTVMDNVGAIGTDIAIVTVQEPPIPNRSPVADAGKDRFASPFEELIFNGNGSFDLDGTIVSYEWDFGDGCTASGMVTTHAFTDFWTYIVTLMVVDDEGATDTETCIVFVTDQSPPTENEPEPQVLNVDEKPNVFNNGSYDHKIPIPGIIKPKKPILILTAGLINMASFEEGTERTLPVEVVSFYGEVHNVHIELIDDGGLEIEIIPIVQDVPEGKIVRFYINMKRPEFSDDISSTGLTVKLRAIGDETESNIEYIDVMINAEAKENKTSSQGIEISTVGTISILAILAAVIGRRLL